MTRTLVGTPDPDRYRAPSVTFASNTTTSATRGNVVVTTSGQRSGPSQHVHRPALYDDRTIPGEVVE